LLFTISFLQQVFYNKPFFSASKNRLFRVNGTTGFFFIFLIKSSKDVHKKKFMQKKFIKIL